MELIRDCIHTIKKNSVPQILAWEVYCKGTAIVCNTGKVSQGAFIFQHVNITAMQWPTGLEKQFLFMAKQSHFIT